MPGRRQMPQFNLNDQQLNDLTEFLKWTGEINTENWHPTSKAEAKIMKTLKYQSQSVAKLYFIGAIALFVGQIVFGLALGFHNT